MLTAQAEPIDDAPRGAADEWWQSWPLLAVATLACAMSTVGFITVGALLRTIQNDTGWTRVEITSAGLIICLATFLIAPWAGRLVDRYGVRKVAIGSCAAFGLCQASVGVSTNSVWSWVATWTLASVAMQRITPNIWAAAVVPRFRVSRGLALGVTMAGVGVANLIIPFVCAIVAERLGWREVYLLIGGFTLVVVLPLLYLVLPRSEAAAAVLNPKGVEEAGTSLAGALSGTMLWRLALAVLIVSGSVGFLNLSMQEILRDRGMTVLAAAAVASLYGPAQIVGRLGAGFLLDRMRGNVLAAALFLLPAGGCALLLGSTSPVLIVIPPILAGLAAGVEIDVIAYLTSRYFGLRHYGAIYGLLFGVFSVAFGLAPLLGSALRDAYGDYGFALVAPLVALPVASLLMATLGRYRY
ncbi:MFS transporter [Sphingomonas sp. MG17]|uniref:MFS transporter n=1 Tax=Sphingomonas tagetis TaxID=2949092 RepID=A0A9X2KQ01_9SPHN|nr:MFS transporter [Sphingomonas tagetis]MCP3731218.1 MFS transporter [Sphingomonas tagetis]